MNQPVDLKKRKKVTMSSIFFFYILKQIKKIRLCFFPVKVTVMMLYCTMLDFQGIAMC